MFTLHHLCSSPVSLVRFYVVPFFLSYNSEFRYISILQMAQLRIHSCHLWSHVQIITAWARHTIHNQATLGHELFPNMRTYMTLAHWSGKGRGEVVPVLNYFSTMPWRHIWEWRYSSTILDLSTRWKWVVSFTPQPLYPWVRSPRYPLDWKLGLWWMIQNVKFATFLTAI
jgi:hypothetical protein